MTHHPVVQLEDGTRRYSNYTRYTPLTPEERTYAVRKPDDPDAVRWHGTWLLPLDVLPDDLRLLPETRPDTDAYDHMGQGRPCVCLPCRRPEAAHWRTLWWKERGVRFAPDPQKQESPGRT